MKLQWNHATYVYNKQQHTDAVIVKASYIDDNGNPQPKLVIHSDPMRSFWITKKGKQTHQFKKEYCSLDELDEFKVFEKDLAYEIHKKIYGYPPRGYTNLKKLCNYPYIYGADISINTLVRRQYNLNFEGEEFIPFTKGMLDIETSVIPGSLGEINLITLTHENQIYVGIHEYYFYEVIKTKEHGTIKKKLTIDKLKELVNEELKSSIEKYDLKIHYQICENEVDIVKWIFARLHENKTDFVGIWNLGFDIPQILKRLEINGESAEDIMCHPEVPAKYRKAYYKADTRKVDHFIDKWHWFYLTGYTQFIDCEALYGRLRKAKGYLPSYALANVLKLENMELQKRSLGKEGSHYIMQTQRFAEYIVYNIGDALSLMLMEWKNEDINSLYLLSGITSFNDFGKQTTCVTNTLFDYCMKNNKVPAAAGTELETEFTKLIQNLGGTVLKPESSKGVGINAIAQRPDFETMLHVFVSDEDFSAYYPNTQCGCNISKETKLSTAIQIENKSRKETQYYFSQAISPKENSMYLCETYYGLPNYLEIEELCLKEMIHNGYNYR
jgi:hypothetical protein